MIRITGGQWKGRAIEMLSEAQARNGGRSSMGSQAHSDEFFLRPTHAKLRQALFNSIQFLVEDAWVLDLFSGTGALGFEALSRGAKRVVFVEKHPLALQLIYKNAVSLGASSQIEVVNLDLVSEVQRLKNYIKTVEKFDILFADPPYAKGYEMLLLNQLPWSELLHEGATVLLEWGKTKSQFEELPERVAVPLPQTDQVQGVEHRLEKVREKIYGDSRLTTFRYKILSESESSSESTEHTESGDQKEE